MGKFRIEITDIAKIQIEKHYKSGDQASIKKIEKIFIDLVEKGREMGITVPIIPVIKPIAVQCHLQILPQIFRIDLPEDLIIAIEKCKSNTDMKQVGIEWAINQSKELKAAGVSLLRYYSMGKSENIRQITSALFLIYNTIKNKDEILH